MTLDLKLRNLYISADSFLFIQHPNDDMLAHSISRVIDELVGIAYLHWLELSMDQVYEIFRRVILPIIDNTLDTDLHFDTTTQKKMRDLVTRFSYNHFDEVWLRLIVEQARDYIGQMYRGNSPTVLNSVVICE